MTIGVGSPDRDYAAIPQAYAARGLASALSVGYGDDYSGLDAYYGLDPSDGANHSGGSSYSEGMPLDASSAGLAGTLGASDPEVLTQITKLNKYMKSLGTPWPNVWHPERLQSTVAFRKGNINQGWNAASQPGAAPGLQDLRLGDLTYEEAMNWTPAPLTDNLGALAQGPRNYAEPAHELRPGFGATDLRENVIPLLVIAAGAYGGYKLAQDRTPGVKFAATAGGAAAGLMVGFVIAMSTM